MELYERIAEVCHEANRAYCQAIGDETQIPWTQAGDWQRLSAVKGVRFKDEFPDSTPADSHRSWLIEKQQTGWTCGPVKDVDLKQHPCMVEYDELPAEQRAKDHIFQAIAATLLRQQKELNERNIPNNDGEIPYPYSPFDSVQHDAQN